MSPLTPTLLDTQTPPIPAGSFPDLPNFAGKVQEALDLVNPSDMEVVVQKKQEIEQQKAHITAQLEELKLSQKDYNFSDYENRLLLSDAEIENILENEIFRKDGEMTEVGKCFYEYLEMVTTDLSKSMKVKMKRKLMRELGLEDRVYEIGGISKCEILPKKIKFENNKQCFHAIQKAGRSWCRSLNIIFIAYWYVVSDFLSLVKKAWDSWIRNLDLWGYDLSKVLNTQDFLTLVKKAWDSWIRSLNLWMKNLTHKEFSNALNTQDFLTLVKKAWDSWIRSLNLWINNLSSALNTQGCFELVKQAGLSGIIRLNISHNKLSEKLNPQDFLTLVKEAGESWIRSLDLSCNISLFSHKFRFEFHCLLSLIKNAWESGIKNLNLWGYYLHDLLNPQDFLTLIKNAWESGIRSLDLRGNNLSAILWSRSDIQKILNITKQYNLKLDY